MSTGCVICFSVTRVSLLIAGAGNVPLTSTLLGPDALVGAGSPAKAAASYPVTMWGCELASRPGDCNASVG